MFQIEEKYVPGFFLAERIEFIIMTKAFSVALVDNLLQIVIIISV